jgi:hypothetical protein
MPNKGLQIRLELAKLRAFLPNKVRVYRLTGAAEALISIALDWRFTLGQNGNFVAAGRAGRCVVRG